LQYIASRRSRWSRLTDVVSDRGVDGALGDGVALEVTVLGVAPRALGAVEAAGAAGVFVDPLLAGRVEGDRDVPLAAVVDDRAEVGVVVGGVADLRPPHVEVLVVEDADRAVVTREVLDLDLADQDRAVEVHDVVAVQRQAQVAVVEADGGRERVAEVALADLPAGVGGPEELGLALAGEVTVDAEPAGAGAGVVLLTDVGEVDVANLVLVVEGDEQAPVADGDVTRHGKVSLWVSRASGRNRLLASRLIVKTPGGA
jgi:hypothetical protein